VSALRKIHEALIVGGHVIDTQPVSPQPPVECDSSDFGRLDMSEWARTIDEIDGLIQQTIRDGLFALIDQHSLTVTDQFDTGRELVEEPMGRYMDQSPAGGPDRPGTAARPGPSGSQAPRLSGA
jgi:hypothetical protein